MFVGSSLKKSVVLHPDVKNIGDIDEFKRVILVACVVKGFNSTLLDTFIRGNDVSLMSDFALGFDGYRLIDELRFQVRKQILLDSEKI